MKEKEFEKLTTSIQEKLGKESASLIADDLGLLITDNGATNKLLAEKEAEITKLKQDKEMLIQSNGNLLQQVAMGKEETHIEGYKKEEEKKPFNFRLAFDENGNFKK